MNWIGIWVIKDNKVKIYSRVQKICPTAQTSDLKLKMMPNVKHLNLDLTPDLNALHYFY